MRAPAIGRGAFVLLASLRYDLDHTPCPHIRYTGYHSDLCARGRTRRRSNSLRRMKSKWHGRWSICWTVIFRISQRRLTASVVAMPSPGLTAREPPISVYIAPDTHRRGMGRALLVALIETSQGRGFRQMVAVIGDSTKQAASVGLHEALGFRHVSICGMSDSNTGRWLDSVLMQRALGPAQPNRLDWSVCDQRQRPVDCPQHALEFVAAANNQASRRNHAIRTLTTREFRIFFDAINWHLRGAAKH